MTVTVKTIFTELLKSKVCEQTGADVAQIEVNHLCIWHDHITAECKVSGKPMKFSIGVNLRTAGATE